MDAWRSASILVKRLYRKSVRRDDLEAYARQIDESARDFIGKYRRIDSQALKKLKLHNLLHLANQIRMYGMLNLWDTEKSEGLNKKVRQAWDHTNRSGSSALQVGNQLALKEAIQTVRQTGWAGGIKLPQNVHALFTDHKTSRCKSPRAGDFALWNGGTMVKVISVINNAFQCVIVENSGTHASGNFLFSPGEVNQQVTVSSASQLMRVEAFPFCEDHQDVCCECEWNGKTILVNQHAFMHADEI